VILAPFVFAVFAVFAAVVFVLRLHLSPSLGLNLETLMFSASHCMARHKVPVASAHAHLR
jgi:hypothetical protein